MSPISAICAAISSAVTAWRWILGRSRVSAPARRAWVSVIHPVMTLASAPASRAARCWRSLASQAAISRRDCSAREAETPLSWPCASWPDHRLTWTFSSDLVSVLHNATKPSHWAETDRAKFCSLRGPPIRGRRRSISAASRRTTTVRTTLSPRPHAEAILRVVTNSSGVAASAAICSTTSAK